MRETDNAAVPADPVGDQRPPTASRWHQVLFALVALTIVAIPASSVLLGLRPSHQWSWSMFSGYQMEVRYIIHLANGDEVEGDPMEAGWFWGHVRYGATIPDVLCENHPEAVEIEWERWDTGSYHNEKPQREGHRRYACSR